MVTNNKKCFEYESYHEGENKVLKIFGNIEFDENVQNKQIELSFKLNKVPTEEEITLLKNIEFTSSNNKLWKILID